MTWTRLICGAALGASIAFSASVKSWDISDYSSFTPGTLQAVSLDEEGLLRLAPAIAELHQTDDAVVWTSTVASDGTIYLGTGHGGKLYRIPVDGDAELLWTAPEIEIFALAADPNGDVYAGTSPSGKVYRVQSDGAAEEFFDPGQEYIWQLQPGPEGSNELYVGTGPEGHIYRVGSDGTGELWFDTEQRHITALALDTEGRLLAAADPSGMLYRIDGKDQAFALYDADLPEIRDIQVAPDGSIYLAAMGGAISLSDNMVQSVSTAATTITVTATASGGGAATSASPLPNVQSPSTPTVSSSPTVNYGVQVSALFLLRPGERAEKLWTSTQENILAMTLEPGHSLAALIATDHMGRLYRVDDQGDAVLLAQTDEQQITSLRRSPRGIVMTSAHSSPTRLLASASADTGRYETAPFDATAISAWGRLEVRRSGPVAIQTRSGNTARPDKTWSAWTAVDIENNSGPVASPPARYLQWAADFNAPEQSLDSVRVAYLTANARPVISSIGVDTAAAAGSSSSSSGASANPYTITVTADGSSSASSSDSSTPAAAGATRLKISWQAYDLDGDDLLANLEFRGEDETEWKLIKADLAEAEFTLDGEALADGRYRFRVAVSDRLDNPGTTARTADRTSSLVLIDHTPSTVSVASSDADQTTFTAIDGASPIVEANYSINAGQWEPLRSDDGLTDSLSEDFTVLTADLPPGEHLVTLRVRDQAGNAGLAKAIVVRP